VDHSGDNKLPIFESGAILLYLAEKFDRFIPEEPLLKSQCLSWLFWQVGSAPYLGGGFGHFYVCQYPHQNNKTSKNHNIH
jgi:GST-like protein